MTGDIQFRSSRRLFASLAGVVVLYGVFAVRNIVWSISDETELLNVFVQRFMFTAVVLGSISLLILKVFPFQPEKTVHVANSALLGICAWGAVACFQWLLVLLTAEYTSNHDVVQDHPLMRIVFGSEGGSDFILLLVTVGLIAPIAEEVFFRGTLHRSLAAVMPRSQAIGLSSAIFAYFHPRDDQMIVAFLVGLIAALFLERTGRLLPGILIHAGLNMGFVIFQYGDNTGIGMAPVWAPGVVSAVFTAVTVYFYVKLPKRQGVAFTEMQVTIPDAMKRECKKGNARESGAGTNQSDGG